MTVWRVPGKGWRYHLMVRGRRYTGAWYATKREAVAACEQRRAELAAGRTAPFRTFGQLANSFLAESVRTKSRAWSQQLEWKLNRVADTWEQMAPGEISTGLIQSALQDLQSAGNGPRSVNEYRKILHSVFAYAVRLRVLSDNPVTPIARQAETSEPQAPIPTAHLRALIVAAPPMLSRFLVVQASTGARWTEIAHLRRTEIFVDAVPPYCLLRTRKTRSAGDRIRKQYLPAPAVSAIREQLAEPGDYLFHGPHGPWSYNTMQKALAAACSRAGLPRSGFHAVRRWAGQVVMELGMSNRVVSRFLGQVHTAATDRYMRVEDPLMIAAGDRVADTLGDVGAGRVQNRVQK